MLGQDTKGMEEASRGGGLCQMQPSMYVRLTTAGAREDTHAGTSKGCASRLPARCGAQNFKEAAKLSAEVKALTAEAEAAEEAAWKARDQLQALSQQQQGSSHPGSCRGGPYRCRARLRCGQMLQAAGAGVSVGSRSAKHAPVVVLQVWPSLWARCFRSQVQGCGSAADLPGM